MTLTDKKYEFEITRQFVIIEYPLTYSEISDHKKLQHQLLNN